MKTKSLIYICVLIFIIQLGCASDDDISFITTSADRVEFVNLDETPIITTDCVRQNLDYAVKVTVKREGTGVLEATAINLNINGQTFSVTFLNEDSKLIPVTLVEGMNTVEVDDTFVQNNISITLPTLAQEFEEVN